MSYLKAFADNKLYLQKIGVIIEWVGNFVGIGDIYVTAFNPFPHDKILDQTKLKAFADDKLNVTKIIIISVFDRVENIMGKGEIPSTSNFSFSHNVFKRLLSQTR